MKSANNTKLIGVLHDLQDMLPTAGEINQEWIFRSCFSDSGLSKNLLLPSRRDFYKIMLVTDGTGIITIGINTYYIDQPTIIFVHPNDIFSWKDLSPQLTAHYLLFKNQFIRLV